MRRLGRARWLLLPAALIVTMAVWLMVVKPLRLEARRRAFLQELPSLPRLERQNSESVALFKEADLEARENPLSAEAIGRLGMLYHAYQFFEPARQCYRLARKLAPEAFSWQFYGGMVEKDQDHYPEAERLLLSAASLQPENADVWAELGDVRLRTHRPEEARADLERALERAPHHPVASVGKARLAMMDRDWQAMIEILEPLLDSYPRLSIAHKYLARAYGEIGRAEAQARHQPLAEHGAAYDGALMEKVYNLAVPPILSGGDPAGGPALLVAKCERCHSETRIYQMAETRQWWGATIRRMQRQAGWDWLTDSEAASLVAYLSRRAPANDVSR